MAKSEFFLISESERLALDRPAKALVDDVRSDPFEMTLFDVGPGEAILLRRRRRAILVDGGAYGAAPPGGRAKRLKINAAVARMLADYLRNTDGGLKLEAIVASHPHVDHLNSLSTLLGSPDVLAQGATYIDNGEPMTGWLQETLAAELAQKPNGLRLRHMPEDRKTRLALANDVEITMRVDDSGYGTPDYRSIFMWVGFKDASFLLTGDAYPRYEQRQAESAPARKRIVDVLKVTHHGSDDGTSEAFLDVVQPLIAVASTAGDEHHNFGRRVRRDLGRAGCRMFHTHAHGDITVRTDGKWRTLDGSSGVVYEVETTRSG